MLIKYNGYNTPDSNDICVALCYFSPVKYFQPLHNLKLFLNELLKYQIPFYIVELLYPNQTQQIPNSIVVRANTVCFVKENLWNIVEKHIPDKYTKIAFMDGDVLYTDPTWLDKTSELLNNYNCGMSHEYVYHDLKFTEQLSYCSTEELLHSVVKIFQHPDIPWWKFHPGFNISIDRNFFHQINGFYEHCITGYGDVLFWWSFIHDNDGPCSDYLTSSRFENQADIYRKYKQNILSMSLSIDQLFYIKDNIAMHLFHGSRNNRYYTTRNGYVDGDVHTYKNDDGVIETKIDGLNQDLIQYWINRREDD